MLDDLSYDHPDREFMVKVVEAGAEAKLLVAELLELARLESARAAGATLPNTASSQL